MNENEKTPLQEHTKNDSSDIERVKEDRARLQREGNEPHPPSDTAPPEPEETTEEEEAEKGHS